MGKTKETGRNNTLIQRVKSWIKEHRQSENPVLRITIQWMYALVSAGKGIKNVLTKRQSREILRMKLFQSNRVHQTTPTTGINRYPVIFAACKKYFEGKKDLRILSFGCATGEEVITLRYYFPDAVIVGAEINQCSLEICRKRKLDDKLIFIDSTDENIRSHGPYDAVFCMAVFQRTPQRITEKGTKSLKRIYPFQKFDNQIRFLDTCVKNGGLMVVHFSQYDFMDTAAAEKYAVYGDYNQDIYSNNTAIFDRDSRRITEKTKRYSIFVKKT